MTLTRDLSTRSNSLNRTTLVRLNTINTSNIPPKITKKKQKKGQQIARQETTTKQSQSEHHVTTR